MDEQLNCFLVFDLISDAHLQQSTKAAKGATSHKTLSRMLSIYLSNLESYLELFGRLDEEPQALLHHVGSWGAREMSCDDEKLWPAGTQNVSARRTADWVQICHL